jgi:hypothetical protein
MGHFSDPHSAADVCDLKASNIMIVQTMHYSVSLQAVQDETSVYCAAHSIL